MGRCKGNIASLRYITPSVSLQYQIKKGLGSESVLAGLTGTAWFYYYGPLRVGNQHGEYLGCQRIFMLEAHNHGLLGHVDFSQVFVLW